MTSSQLKALERHAQAAADIITADVRDTAADVLADPEEDARIPLALLVDAATFARIAREARAFRKEALT